MTPARQRPLFERLLLACVALLFLLQPLVGAAGSCTLRAKLFGSACCCAPTPKKSCCSERAEHDSSGRAEHDAPAPKRCNCELSFHARLDAGMARALAFERTLRC